MERRALRYRDETLLLRERLLALETDRARLEGQRRGLDVAVAEAEEATRVASKKLLALPTRVLTKRTLGSLIGWALGTAGTVGALVAVLVAGAFTCDAVVDHTARGGSVVRSTRHEVVVGQHCTVQLDEVEDAEERCSVAISCGLTTIYQDVAHCSVRGDELEVFDHDAREGRDVVVVPTHRAAVVRDARGVVAIDLGDE